MRCVAECQHSLKLLLPFRLLSATTLGPGQARALSLRAVRQRLLVHFTTGLLAHQHLQAVHQALVGKHQVIVGQPCSPSPSIVASFISVITTGIALTVWISSPITCMNVMRFCNTRKPRPWFLFSSLMYRLKISIR